MGITLFSRGHPVLAEGLWARAAALGENPVALGAIRHAAALLPEDGGIGAKRAALEAG